MATPPANPSPSICSALSLPLFLPLGQNMLKVLQSVTSGGRLSNRELSSPPVALQCEIEGETKECNKVWRSVHIDEALSGF